MSDQQGAIAAVASKPYGELILWLVVLGLTGYITWLLTQVFIEGDHDGTKIKDFFIRIGYFFTAIFHHQKPRRLCQTLRFRRRGIGWFQFLKKAALLC
ncbi:DUF1206 domain-containing protein [Virgibacillus necropolis]|uniref:DUF1206 domain-containing protein n=1 Tax=Virgibacillus necropolis TaxID=163877 RepID=UPI0013747F17|nr:DUF1206 domain-containing protein [Virgibacillus necropolis]